MKKASCKNWVFGLFCLFGPEAGWHSSVPNLHHRPLNHNPILQRSFVFRASVGLHIISTSIPCSLFDVHILPPTYCVSALLKSIQGLFLLRVQKQSWRPLHGSVTCTAEINEILKGAPHDADWILYRALFLIRLLGCGTCPIFRLGRGRRSEPPRVEKTRRYPSACRFSSVGKKQIDSFDLLFFFIRTLLNTLCLVFHVW